MCVSADWYPLHSVEPSLKLLQKLGQSPDISTRFLSKAMIGFLSRRHQNIEPALSDLTDKELEKFSEMLSTDSGFYLSIPECTIGSLLRGLAESSYNRNKLPLYFNHENIKQKWAVQLAVLQKPTSTDAQAQDKPAEDSVAIAEACLSSLHLADQEGGPESRELQDRKELKSEESQADNVTPPFIKTISDHTGKHSISSVIFP